uniref:SHC1 n=1 Tax=Knipowitschia caucasica TaxID=637954 RepID=A0AAV2IUV0_KNICA
MLHRTKYNRFRNESVTSVDDLLHGLSINPKISAGPQPAAETPYTPPSEVQAPSAPSAATSHGSDHLEDGGTLCTLINKVSNLKFSNSGSLLGIKGLPSAVKDLAVSKLQGGGGSGSGPAVTTTAVTAFGVGATQSSSQPAPCSQPETTVNMSKKTRMDEPQPGSEDWNPGGGGALVSKPPRGWLHSSDKISGPGVTYIVKVRMVWMFSCMFEEEKDEVNDRRK